MLISCSRQTSFTFITGCALIPTRARASKKYVRTRDEIREVILQEGFNQKIGAFTQLIGGSELDATALTIPLLGLLPATDERVKSTITQIKEKLSANGLVYRLQYDAFTLDRKCSRDIVKIDEIDFQP